MIDFLKGIFSFIGYILLGLIGLFLLMVIISIIVNTIKDRTGKTRKRLKEKEWERKVTRWEREKNDTNKQSTDYQADHQNNGGYQHIRKIGGKYEICFPPSAITDELVNVVIKDTDDKKELNLYSQNSNIEKTCSPAEKLEYNPDIPFYKKVESTITPGEKYVLPLLVSLIDPNKYKIVTHIPYSEYLKPNDERDSPALSAESIKGRIADFGIETIDHKPVMVIEYNDKTHWEKDRKKRDDFLRTACYMAKLPLVSLYASYFNSSSSHTVREMRTRLYQLLLVKDEKKQISINPLNLPELKCPLCGRELNIVTGDFGAFLTHSRYDACEYKVNIFSTRK